MYALLRSIWDEPRPSRPPPLGWADWALTGAVATIAVLEGVLRPDVPYRVATVVLAVGVALTLLGRRSRPLLMVAVVFTASGLAPVLMAGHSPNLYVLVFILLLPYSLFRWGSGREAVIGAAIVLVKLAVTLLLGYETSGNTVVGVAILGAFAAFGTAIRYRAKARMRELDQAKLLERERLARDLHDTVAHHVSAMAIRAQAGLATATAQPEAAVDALRLIEAEASRALTEMRGMVRLLRKHEPADHAPSPGLRDVEELAARTYGGPHVEVEIDGELDDLSPPVATALYRLAQEAVTNARRHARHATRIEVKVAGDDREVQLSVTDDGETSTGRSPSGSPGFGLAGMTERAGLLGGRCEAGPNPGRGWTVTAVLPRTGPAG